MQAYIYDNDRFYVGEMTCQRDPLESEKQGREVYLTPANSTSVQPTIIEGAKPRWTGTAWEQYPNDKLVYGYTNNEDGTINYYGPNHLAEELQRIHKEVTLSFSDTEPVSINGVYWLSADNEDYKKAKAESEKNENIAALDAQYSNDKRILLSYYTDALLNGDTDAQAETQNAMTELNAKYDDDYRKIMEG